MNDEEINIAIAESVGWHHCYEYSDSVILGALEGRNIYQSISDYANDLNAIHEVEKTLPEDKVMQYGEELDNVVYNGLSDPSSVYYPFKATARQRCEAYLRTIGKWEETGDE